MEKKTSIIIITYNHFDYTKECIESIYKYTKEGTYEIVVVDNLSTDETREWLKKQKFKVILNDENLGFPKACNQGIEIAEKGNDILLLNNDTIVTENWLDNLRICLDSDLLIGAVGACCNHNENEQGCDFSYDDFDTMQELAKKNNISDPKQWEEKVFLIGFCILIKREVIDKIKVLDEGYSPGYIEDNDLSLRIIEQGYKLILCHDCFIHHYLGTAFRKDLNQFYPILNKNREYFQKKWNFSSFAFDEIKTSSIRLLKDPTKILELHCGIAPTILKIKYQFPEVEIHGVEEDSSKRYIAKYVSTVYSSLDTVDQNDYDCILIGNSLETVSNPIEFIMHLKKYLKKGGYIIGDIQNIASGQNILSLLNDQWYFIHQNQRNSFTITDIQKLFESQHYQLEFIFSWYQRDMEKENELIEKLKKIKEKNYEIVSYSYRCKYI